MITCTICARKSDNPCITDDEVLACENPSFLQLDLIRLEKARGRISKMKAIQRDRAEAAAGKVWNVRTARWEEA